MNALSKIRSMIPSPGTDKRSKLRSWAVGLLCGLMFSPLSYNIYSFFVSTPGNVVAMNSDTINKSAIACELLHGNSDIMSRFTHFTAPHPAGVEMMLCPECSGSEMPLDDTLLGEPVDTFKTKLSQVHSDSEEINDSVGRIISSLIIQKETLEFHLDHLRKNASP